MHRVVMTEKNFFYPLQFQSSKDLTGTRIVSSKPIAVLSGSVRTSVGAELMGDHVVEMLSPTNTWGREFLTLPISNRTSGDVFRITGIFTDEKVIPQKEYKSKSCLQ